MRSARHPERFWQHLFEEPLTAWRAARIIAAATAVVVVAAGLLMRVFEPSTFPNVWLGLWWSVQTVTSVGYGDLVPHTVPGRLLALLVMLNGIAFLTVVVATISATFVETARRRAEQHRLFDDPVTSGLRRIEARLTEIERRLDGAEPETPGGASSTPPASIAPPTSR